MEVNWSKSSLRCFMSEITLTPNYIMWLEYVFQENSSWRRMSNFFFLCFRATTAQPPHRAPTSCTQFSWHSCWQLSAALSRVSSSSLCLCVYSFKINWNWREGVVLRSNSFGGVMQLKTLHTDEPFWLGVDSNQITVKPVKMPIIIKAELAFKKAILNKWSKFSFINLGKFNRTL